MNQEIDVRFEQVPEGMPEWVWRAATWLDETATWALDWVEGVVAWAVEWVEWVIDQVSGNL